MTSPEATAFRALTRSVFDLQSAILRYGDLVNAPFGQTSARWRVLFHLAQGNTSVADIARATGYSRQAVQRLADALVVDHLAAYAPDPSDRRRQRIHLSDQGQTVFTKMEDSFDIWSKRLVGQLSLLDLPHVVEILRTMQHVIEQDSESVKRSTGTNDER